MNPNTFESLFRKQKYYNLNIRREKGGDKISWTKTYLLGLVSEVDEVLREMRWKAQRSLEHVDPARENIAFELADLTKYVLSLWEVWGFTVEEIFSYCHKKSDLLERIREEDSQEIPTGKLVIITDLDGTICDWRTSFREFIRDQGFDEISDSEDTLDIEISLGLGYNEYLVLKDKFESEGYYAFLYPYFDALNFLQRAKENDAIIISFTARPFHKHKRIWTDTWEWIDRMNAGISQLRSGSETRILFGKELSSTNRVVMLEDNPQLMLRAANAGLQVIARRHKYNDGVSHPLIKMIDSFDEIDIKEI